MNEKHPASGQHTGRRLRQFLRPDGRTVHVAASPEAAETFRRQLSQDQKDAEIDLIIHGSPEHLDAIREVHAHNEEKRNAFRRQHTDVYAEFEKVQAELDALSAELSSITRKEVALDANFSRYGYSAHIRTKEADSSASSVMSGQEQQKERRRGESMKFWKKPVVRQYYHKGLIWRASETEEVASFELFVDLLYVGIIAVNGDRAAEDPTGEALLQFCVTFILSWKLWSELTLVVSWFETDDIFQRICVLFFLACLTGYTTNITNVADSTYAPLIAFYPTPVPSGLLYMDRLYDTYELFGTGLVIFVIRTSERYNITGINRWSEYFQFYPAINIEHKTERTNAFVTIVLGYSVVALLYQNRASFGINAFFGKAILGLVQAFALNMIYFEIDNRNISVHAIRRHYLSFTTWVWLHLPFIMSVVLASGALSRLVIAHDCANADPETLSEAYALRSLPEVDAGLRWFYSAGLGIALACMAGISFSHTYHPHPRLPTALRLALRLLVALILLLLPLAPLTSLSLIATTTSLTLAILIVDLYGSGDRGEAFWRSTKGCRYETECVLRKGDMERMRDGAIGGVEELSRRDVGVGGGAMAMS